MTCQLETRVYDAEQPEFWASRIVKARKPHRCCECAEVIQPGESYERFSGRWDGVFEVYKTCRICQEIRDAVFCSYAFGEMWTDLENESVFTLALTGLSEAALDKLQAFWREGAGEDRQ